MDCAQRPPELEIEDCTIRTSYGTGGQVTEVRGPYQPQPDHTMRPLLGGWTIVYKHPRDGSKCWINEVFVEDGAIYSCPWRDRIEVVQQVERQMKLF